MKNWSQPRLVLASTLVMFGLGWLWSAEVRADPNELGARYIESWKAFYPTQAVRQGFLGSLRDYENRTPEAITEWIRNNRQTLDQLNEILQPPGTTPPLSSDLRLDSRLLRTQVLKELDRWEVERPHRSSLALFADLIAHSIAPVIATEHLSRAEKREVLAMRLEAIPRLARGATASLVDGAPGATKRALATLRGVGESFERELAEFGSGTPLDEARRTAGVAVGALIAHVERELLPKLTLPDEPILGRETYARKLAIYTDSALTPEALEALALREIEAAKRALAETSQLYFETAYPDETAPDSEEALIARAFADVEANRPSSEAEYLERLRDYARDVERFVREAEVATVPDHNTLSVELAPESAGPMARIGFVRSAPAFHPNPWTTWFLATIPDSHPETERIDFWRSFNYSFKRFIVIHELFPGHYMQLKLLRENPHRVRVLFPYRPFIEGWATFTERVVLDAGYAEGDWLTRLAQLRKRLENANRAYASVQAHCNGWSEEEVFRFSVETSLLAPQFAKSLWGRLMRSPMQILTYMLMGLELQELYEAERDRLGDRFVLRDFMDTVLRTGPAPVDELRAALLGASS